MTFQRAVKYRSFLRMALAGPAGAGKTYTALTFATALAVGQGIALIDTEHGSARKYADLLSFDVQELETFHPHTFIKAIHEAEQAGYAVLVIDSLSHAWNGKGGLLEVVDAIAARKYKGSTFNAWKDATPIQNALIDTILTSPLHIIATRRSKMDHVQEKNEQTGRTDIRKVGLAPIQREGMEYEFDIMTDLDILNTMIVQKSRCPALSGAIIPRPDTRVIETLRPWLAGTPPPVEHHQVQRVEPSTPPVQATNPSGELASGSNTDQPLDPAVAKERLNTLYSQAKKLSVCKTDQEFVQYVCKLLRLKSWDVKALTSEHLTAIARDLKAREQQAA